MSSKYFPSPLYMRTVSVGVIDGGVFKKNKPDGGALFIISHVSYEHMGRFSVSDLGMGVWGRLFIIRSIISKIFVIFTQNYIIDTGWLKLRKITYYFIETCLGII